MKACIYETYGDPEALQYVDVADPAPAADQVLVRLEAAGLSPLDWKLRAGLLAGHFSPKFPKIPGRDGTGRVIACGPGVTAFKEGDRVCVMASPAGAAGTHAEMIAVGTDSLVALPDALSMREGAALINAGLSAWVSVMRTAKIQAGQKVLVHGGAGAVGGLMVQLARYLGAEVAATCSSANIDYVHALGAQHVIAYDRDDFSRLEPQDIVIDSVGGEVHDRSYSVLKPGGHLVWLVAAPIVDRSDAYDVRVTRALITDDREAVSSIMELAARGILKAQIADILPLAEAREAHRRLQGGHVSRGRLLLEA